MEIKDVKNKLYFFAIMNINIINPFSLFEGIQDEEEKQKIKDLFVHDLPEAKVSFTVSGWRDLENSNFFLIDDISVFINCPEKKVHGNFVIKSIYILTLFCNYLPLAIASESYRIEKPVDLEYLPKQINTHTIH